MGHFMLSLYLFLKQKGRRQVIFRLICPGVEGTWEKESPAGGEEAWVWGKWVRRGIWVWEPEGCPIVTTGCFAKMCYGDNSPFPSARVHMLRFNLHM